MHTAPNEGTTITVRARCRGHAWAHLPPRLRVLLVDDQPLFRRALATLISAQFDMTVVGEGENGRDALEKVRALRPDIVVMDVNMPVASGVDGVTAIRAAGFTTPIVMLTVSEDDDDLFESIKAGANGYLLKNVRPEELFEDLRGVMRGEAPIAPAVASKLLDALRTGGIPLRGQAATPAGRHRADPPRVRDPRAGGQRAVQQGDRERAHDHRGHGQEPRAQLAREAPPHQPRPGGRLRGSPGATRTRTPAATDGEPPRWAGGSSPGGRTAGTRTPDPVPRRIYGSTGRCCAG